MTACSVREKLESLSSVERTREIISLLGDSPSFGKAALEANAALVRRDRLDEHALAEGVEYAQHNGILPCGKANHTWHPVTVDCLSPIEVAREIDNMAHQDRRLPEAIAVSGLSGIGKGTTVDALAGLRPNYWTWSNGDVFRFITYLVLSGEATDMEDPDHLARRARRVAESVSYQPQQGIVGTTNGGPVSLCDTPSPELRSIEVSSTVPTVARYTQGHVIRLANAALEAQPAGACMLIEGRKTTLDFVGADLRVELQMSDRASLGARRVAQRLAELLMEEGPLRDEQLEGFFRRVYR
jgi:cytidylate kinase